MEFRIMTKPVESEYKDCFVFEVKVMYGDADGYGKVKISGFKKDCEKSQAHMEDLVKTFEGMKAAYPHGRGGYDDYDHVEGFSRWFGGEILDDFRDEYEKMEKWEQRLYWNDWPRDPAGDGIQSSFKNYDVFYYDSLGNKHEVKVIK